MNEAVREKLGKTVRATWVTWAKEQADPKPSHLLPWEELDEPNKEVDRRIAEAVVKGLAEVLIPIFLPALLSEEDVRQLLQETLQ